MENATKALVMAAGVLIALMLIGILTYTVRTSSELKKENEENVRIEQITKFNQEYTSYNKALMRGTDVITVINKANDNNEKNDFEETVMVTVKLKMGTEISDATSGYIYNPEIVCKVNGREFKLSASAGFQTVTDESRKNLGIYNEWIYKDKEALKTFKKRFFKCSGIEYNELTGYVNQISFEEVAINEQGV